MENKRQIFKEHQHKIRTQKKWNWTKPYSLQERADFQPIEE